MKREQHDNGARARRAAGTCLVGARPPPVPGVMDDHMRRASGDRERSTYVLTRSAQRSGQRRCPGR